MQTSDTQTHDEPRPVTVTFSAMHYAMLEVAAADIGINVTSLVRLAAVQQARRIIDDIISDIEGSL